MITKITSKDRANTVVVTVDAETTLSSTLELASALAVASQSELHGLFIEDLDLLRVASLPFAREVMLAGGQPRILDNQQLLCSLNARSRHFRQSLERYAQQSALVWTYSTVRGRRRSMELAESAGAEFLIIGQPGDRQSQILNAKRILLINDKNPRLQQALDVVLANIPGQSIELLLASPMKVSAWKSLQQLTSKLEAHPNSSLSQINPGTLVSTLTLKAQPVDFVIASRQEPELLQQIMQCATCPVIVVC
jgi:hypothetical protein